MLPEAAIPVIPALPDMGFLNILTDGIDGVIASINAFFSDTAQGSLTDFAEKMDGIGTFATGVWNTFEPVHWIFYIGFFLATAFGILALVRGTSSAGGEV